METDTSNLIEEYSWTHEKTFWTEYQEHMH
jgi:hypothetical protein